ncbi:hypothetical protein ACHAXT_002721 [Thalassiosira profunda]
MRHPSTAAMILAAAASAFRGGARGGAILTQNGVGVMGWQFAPITRSRRAISGRAAIGRVAKRSSASSLMNRRSNLVMWGEEDAPKRRDAIPSSKFSSEAGGGTRQRRPARRSRPSGGESSGGGSWYDDEEDSFDRERSVSRRDQRSSGGWDDDDGDDWFSDYQPSPNRGRGGGRGNRQPRDGRGRGGYDRPRGRGRGGDFRRDDSRGRGRGGRGRDDRRERGKPDAAKINLKLIENAGYQHLYGIAPVLNALKADIRDFDPAEEVDDKEDLLELQNRLSDVDGIDVDFAAIDEELAGPAEGNKKKVKPEALPAPHLFVQEGAFDDAKRSFRSHAKKDASAEILALAKESELPVVEVDKGVLNTLCGNRPHQGFVLRCGGLEFEPVRRLPMAGNERGPRVWLALDEVVDPQNLGALMRSAFFLGKGPAAILDDDDLDDAIGGGQVGILVCSKNSSPLTPTVSAASAGALEFMTIYSTSNLPKLLKGAAEDGWRILGAAAEVPGGAKDVGGGNAVASEADNSENWYLDGDSDDEGDENDSGDNEEQEQRCFDLNEVETDVPTILVLGSEGRGLRTLVARACTGFVSIPGGVGNDGSDGGQATKAGVDSLNVSVTGGIMLWHLISR